MHLYIFEYLDAVSTAYHSGGGAVIIAPTLNRARAMYRAHIETLAKGEWSEIDERDFAEADTIEPDHTYEVSLNTEPRIIVFPDAGCC